MALGCVEKKCANDKFRRHKGNYGAWLKKAKHRVERRRAKRDPECVPGYRFYQGWSS